MPAFFGNCHKRRSSNLGRHDMPATWRHIASGAILISRTDTADHAPRWTHLSKLANSNRFETIGRNLRNSLFDPLTRPLTDHGILVRRVNPSELLPFPHPIPPVRLRRRCFRSLVLCCSHPSKRRRISRQLLPGDRPLYIGSSVNGYPWQGKVDEIKKWNRKTLLRLSSIPPPSTPSGHQPP